MPTTDGRISKIKLPNGKLYDVGSGGSGTVDSTWVTGSTNPVESQLIQNTKPGLINTSTHGEAFGNNTTGNATGSYSHIEGNGTQATGENSHAEGMSTVAGGAEGHVEGYLSHADGEDSHAEGWHAYANAKASHAQNYYTIAGSDYQTALGKYNVEDTNGTYAVIIGNGTGDNARSNALAIGWDGRIYTGNSNVGYTINELKTMIDSKPDKNENWGFLYNDNSTWSDGPWYKIADASITTTHTDTNIVLRFQRAWYNTGLSYGTLVVHARTNQNDTGISSIQATWRDAGANLPYDQCVVTYTSNTSGGSTIQIWTKLQLRYDGYCYEKEVDDSRQSMTDNWTLYSYKNTEGETSLPTTQTVLQPSFGQQSLNQLTFYYDNFSTATSSSRYQKITFVTTDVEDSSMTSDRTIYIPKENGTMALVSDVEEATTVNSVSGTNGSVRFDYIENSKHKIGIDDGLQYEQTTGTASVEGVSQLVLGNSTQSGTAGNKTGSLKIYNAGGRCGIIDHDSNIKNTTVHLPAESGTLALQSEVSAVNTAAQGYANSAKADAKAYTDSEIDTLQGEYGTTWNDNTDWASAPWYPIATIDVTTTYTNVTLALHIQRGNGASQKSVGTFVVTARVNESFTNITSFNSVWTNIEDGLLADDAYYKVRVTCTKYDNKASFAVWLKLSVRYDSFSYRKIRGAYRNSRSDNGFDPDCWVINSWQNVNGYSLYHTGDSVIQCVPSFGDTAKSSLSFMYNDTSSYEQGTDSNPVYVNHGSVKLSTDDVSGTHTDYTIKLPKKNGTMALLSDIPTIPPIPTDYIPLGGTASNSPVTGKIEFTGNASYLLFDTNNTGIRFVDSSDDQFSGVAWNGANFWVGARAGSQPTHAGRTFISTGWDTTNNVGYNTIAISIPQSKDGSTTATTRYVVHTGDNTFNAEDTLNENKEIKLNNSGYSKDIRFRATNSHSDLWFGAFGSANDGGGIYNISGGGFVIKSTSASGSLVNTFYGNASSATAIKMNQMQSTSKVTRYLTLTPNLSGDATNQYANNGLWTESTYGSTSAVGYTHLYLGNSTNSGTAGNNRGFLYLYGPGSAYGSLQFDGTSDVALSLPESGGTLALKSEIKITNSTVSTSGSGNAITSLSISSGQLVASKGSTFLTSSDVGTAASKSYTTSVTSGSSSLVTSGAVYSAMTGWSTLSISTASSPGITGCSVQSNASLVNPSLHLVFIDVLLAFNQNVSAGTYSKTVTAAISSTYRPDAHVTLPFSNGASINGNAIMHTGGYIQLNIFTAITASTSSVKNIRVAGMYAYS